MDKYIDELTGVVVEKWKFVKVKEYMVQDQNGELHTIGTKANCMRYILESGLRSKLDLKVINWNL